MVGENDELFSSRAQAVEGIPPRRIGRDLE
jgi:hypothetical protein